MYQYPYGNAQQLNLDWILGKLKELESRNSDSTLEEVANAFITASYDNTATYNVGDIVYHNGKLYACTTVIPVGENWNENHWNEILIGNKLVEIYNDLLWFNNLSKVLDGTTNAFNSANVTAGCYINSSGEIIERTGLSVSDYIPTIPNARIVSNESLGSNTYYYAFYTKNKELVSVGALNNNNNYITTPDNAFYFRTTANNNGISILEIYVITPDKLNTNYLPKYYIQPAGKTFSGKKYIAFPDMVNFNNKKVIAVRAGDTHTSQDGSILIFEVVNGNVQLKKEITSTVFGTSEDLRDPSIISINKGKNLLLSVFATVEGVSTHNSYAAILDTNYNVLETATILSNSAIVLWGKPLITPTNHLLFSAYGVSGKIYAVRSNEIFTETTLAGLTYTQTTVSGATTLFEMSFEYVGDYLIAIARRNSSSAMICKTINLEGTSGWSTPAALTQVIHAPRIITIKSSKYVVVCGAYRATGAAPDRQPAVFLIDIETPACVNYCLLSNDTTYGGYVGAAKINDFCIDFTTYEDVNFSVTTKLINYRVNLLEALPELNKIMGFEKPAQEITLPLAVTDGGTGASTSADAKTNLGIVDPYYPVNIADGGTGATTIDGAKQNLKLGVMCSDTFQIDANTSTTLNVPNNSRGVLIVLSSIADIITLSVSSSGVVTYASLLTPAELSYSTNTNQLIITNSTTANLICAWIDFNSRLYTKV